nr:sugar-binding transcriptional regulator [Heyndrickxia ginsengihumi]
MIDSDKDRLSIDVARLYYQSDYSQQQIADHLNLSRPTVSRLLQHAKDQGYVSIHIYDPLEDMDVLSDQIKKKYKLDQVRIAYTPLNKDHEIIKHLGRVGANFLFDVVKDGDIIGVTWGRTMYSLSSQLKAKQVHGVEVVQLKGGVTHARVNNYAYETVHRIAEAFNTISRYLPLPVIFDRPEIKEMVENDSHMRQIIDLGKQANIAIFTVGTVLDDALLFQLGYLNAEEKKLLQQNAVGDICSRFFNKDGNICNEAINNRTIGIELDELRKKERSILVAGGQRKIPAIRTALIAGYANTLITDQYTARALLEERSY